MDPGAPSWGVLLQLEQHMLCIHVAMGSCIGYALFYQIHRFCPNFALYILVPGGKTCAGARRSYIFQRAMLAG